MDVAPHYEWLKQVSLHLIVDDQHDEDDRRPTQPLVRPATATATAPAITEPTSGMKAPKATNSARGATSGTPRIVRAMAMTTPWKTATMSVPRM